MRSHIKLGAAGAALILLAAGAVWGSTFTYFEDFNDYNNMPSNGTGPEPIGWVSWDNGVWSAQESKPRIFAGDYGGWNTDYGTNNDDYYHSYWGTLGSVNYAVPWSGGARYNLIHSGWDPNYRNADVWYSGVAQDGYTAKHTGTYPMDLTGNSLRAEFDVIIRSGVRATIQNNGTASGGVFAVQAVGTVDDIQLGGNNGGWLGWGLLPGLPGFAVEFDVQPSSGDPAGGTDGNHIGIDAAGIWNNLAGLGSVPSIATNLDLGVTLPFQMELVGDNNQPLHVTVYYNDPAHGGLGVVQVYLKVRAADKAVDDPPVPAGQAPFSFGEDQPDGILVAQACIGAWPDQKLGVFGFTASNEWYKTNEIFQVDNVNVTTDTAQGTPCVPPWPPVFDPGTAVELTAPTVAPDATNLSQPGWSVRAYTIFSEYWNNHPIVDGTPSFLEQSIAYIDALGLAGPAAVGEPSINYADPATNGANSHLPGSRPMPGWAVGYNNDWVGLLAKGYIYFPVAGSYSICVNADDGAELKIGGQVVTHNENNSNGGGQNSGTYANLHVANAGVYTIELLYTDQFGGGMVEVYRRTQPAWDNPLTMPAFNYLAIGSDNLGVADQPVVYGLLSGNPPATDIGAAGAYPVPAINVLPDVRVGDVTAATGTQGFTCKTVWAPNRWYWEGDGGCAPNSDIWLAWTTAPDMQYGKDADGDDNGHRWIDAGSDHSGGAVTTLVNFGGGGGSPWPAELEPRTDFPGMPADAHNFGFRVQGYAVFPAAGTYLLSTLSNGRSYLYIGNQAIWNTATFDEPAKFVAVNIPQAGTYPIRVDFTTGGLYRGIIPQTRPTPDIPASDDRDNRMLVLIEAAPTTAGNAKVPVNSAQSRIKVYTSCAAGDYVYAPLGTVIPASAKVAEVGQGSNSGFNATVAQPSPLVDMFCPARGDMLTENSWAYPTEHTIPGNVLSMATPDVMAFWTRFDAGGDFYNNECMPYSNDGSQHLEQPFLSSMLFWDDNFPGIAWNAGGNTNQFAATFSGYIEFPVAGDYGFNMGADGTGQIWIGGMCISSKDYNNSWPEYLNPGIAHVSVAGIYPIRATFVNAAWNTDVSLVQLAPAGGHAALLNSPQATVHVYRDLATTLDPAVAANVNAVRIPASAKLAVYGGGGTKGFHVQTVQSTYIYGDGNVRSPGHDRLYNLDAAHNLLATVLDGAPALSQSGVKVFDGVIPRLAIVPGYDSWEPYPSTIHDDFPGLPAATNWFAVRVTGYLALKQGGHIFVTMNDDGVRVTIGGKSWETPGAKGARGQDQFYVYAPEDGIYPLEIEYLNVTGGAALNFFEVLSPSLAWWTVAPAAVNGWQVVNDSDGGDTFSKVFVTLCPVPWPDADGDHDVDEADFGAFQACFGGQPEDMTVGCKCLDRDGTPGIGIGDFTQFMNCWTGPTVLSTGCQ